jgi:hypothetical protein
MATVAETTTSMETAAKAKLRHGIAARNGRVRSGSSTLTLLIQARVIVAAKIAILSRVRRSTPVTWGTRMMRGQCHK